MNRYLSHCGLIFLIILALSACQFNQVAYGANNSVSSPVSEVSAAQSGSVIRLQPSTQQLNVGATITVEIQIDNVANLTAAAIKLQFNPGILQVQDTDPAKDGVQIEAGNFLSPDFVVVNEVNHETGLIHYAVLQLSTTEPANGSGVLAKITFRASGPGNSQLTFSGVQLSNKESQEIAVTSQAGEIIVGQVGTSPTDTFTPTLTLIPGQATTTPATSSTPTSTEEQATATSTPTPSQPTNTPTPLPSPTPLPPTNTPVPPVTDIPSGATFGFCYRVQEGDTLYSLGQQFKLSPHTITVVNDLYPPDQIYPHLALFIPEQVGSGPNVYRVQSGDTLTKIAEVCRLSLPFLARVNNLEQTTVVQAGHVLVIPIPPYPPPSRFQYLGGSPPVLTN